jgi:RimJ/RimL family protein N-acetyltransferase
MAAIESTQTGRNVRLEPLGFHHVPDLVAAAAENPALYAWSAVPQGIEAMSRYVETALAWHAAGTAVPFAIVRSEDERVVGSSRFFDCARWPWPAGQTRAASNSPDTAEIGYTWFAACAVRTGANTETKLLMLTLAFEQWEAASVCFHTDARNTRSRAALERIGATFEGVLRAHRLGVDLSPRDSARFAIVATDWPTVKRRLQALLDR